MTFSASSFVYGQAVARASANNNRHVSFRATDIYPSSVHIPETFEPDDIHEWPTLSKLNHVIQMYRDVDQKHKTFFFSSKYVNKTMEDFIVLYTKFANNDGNLERKLSSDELYEFLQFAFTHPRISQPNDILPEKKWFFAMRDVIQPISFIDLYYTLNFHELFTKDNFDRVSKLNEDHSFLYSDTINMKKPDQRHFDKVLIDAEKRDEIDKIFEESRNKLNEELLKLKQSHSTKLR